MRTPLTARHGRITRGDVMNLCMLTGRQATKLLRRLVQQGKLVDRGSPPRWVYYELPGALDSDAL